MQWYNEQEQREEKLGKRTRFGEEEEEEEEEKEEVGKSRMKQKTGKETETHRALEYRKTENVSKFRINFFSYHLIVSVETKHETRFQRCNFVSHVLMEF